MLRHVEIVEKTSTTINRRYDADAQLTEQNISDDIQSLNYAYDSIGNITAITDQNDSSQSKQYSYDAVNRLTQQSQNARSIGYSYDAVGNRLTATQTNSDTNSDATSQSDQYQYPSDSNRLISLNNQSQSYSNTGGSIRKDLSAAKLISDEQKTLLNFSYDAQDRIASASSNSQLQASYTYNNNGQRSVKLSNTGDISHYHFNIQGQLIGESQYNSNGTLQQHISIIWLNNKPIAQINTSNTPSILHQRAISYIHFDHLNTPRLTTNPSKTIIWTWHSEAFGSTLANEDPDNDNITTQINLRFPGQYFDSETGLHYNYFRYYDSATGRYVTSDPIGLRGGVNTFGYVGGNPVNFIDHEGKYLVKAGKWLYKKSPLKIDLYKKKKDGVRYCQVRYKNKPVFRLESHPTSPTDRTPRLHYHIAPNMSKHHYLD